MSATDVSNHPLDEHWAVAALPAADRDALVAHAERALRAGAAPPVVPLVDGEPPPESLTALGSAYDFAARERLNFRDHDRLSAVPASSDDVQDRRSALDYGARRAFLLLAAAPLPLDDPVGALYETLHLTALAAIAGRRETFARWLDRHRDALFAGAGEPGGAAERWELQLLRYAVELWTEVLAGDGPSGVERAMELAATIREQRGPRERQLLAGCDEAEEMGLRFHLFALRHLAEAATDLLVYRLHGTPGDIRSRLHLALTLARSASAGDLRLIPVVEWLSEAASRLVAARTPQLDLLPTARATGITR